MNDTTGESTYRLDYQRSKAILKAYRRVTASLLQRYLGIGYGRASQLAAELSGEQPRTADRLEVDLSMSGRTLQLLFEIRDGQRGRSDIGIAEDEFHELLTGDGFSSKVTIRSGVGRAAGPDRASLAVRLAVAPNEEFAQALRGAVKLVVLVSATSATLMGRELNTVLGEARRRVDEACSISLCIRYLEQSQDPCLAVTVIFSLQERVG